MEKIEISKYKKLNELPLDLFNYAKYSIYVIDKKWNYLFVNNFVTTNLGKRSIGMLGKNMWEFFPELATDSSFNFLRSNTENGRMSNFITTSPLTTQRLSIAGYPLYDCFVFTASIIPKKKRCLTSFARNL